MSAVNSKLDELSQHIINYIVGNIQYSPFDSVEGTTRREIVEVFFVYYDQISSNVIAAKVIKDLDRKLSPLEHEKLNEITNAWREWDYIFQKAKDLGILK